MSQYRDLADVFRARIQSGDWTVGVQLPGITALQKEYGVRSLNTVRGAQQILVGEGLLETRQGVPTVVIGTESLTSIDVRSELTTIRDRLDTVVSAIDSQKAHKLIIDLDDPDEESLHFVLTNALKEWVAGQRLKTEDDGLNVGDRIEWAETADRLIARIEAAR